MSIVLFDSDLDGSTALSNINPAAFTWMEKCSEASAYKIQRRGITQKKRTTFRTRRTFEI